MWQAAALIPKGGGYYHGIGLVRVVWNVVTVIINHRLSTNIYFHDVLHRLLVSYGMGTAFLGANRLQKLMAMKEDVLYEIFLDLHRA